MTLRERLTLHAYGPCAARSIPHTHCQTCGSMSVVHNRADCAAFHESATPDATPEPIGPHYGRCEPDHTETAHVSTAPHPATPEWVRRMRLTPAERAGGTHTLPAKDYTRA